MDTPASPNSLRNKLRDLLDARLSLNELKTLVFNLRLDYDNLAGDIKRTRIEYLIWIMGQANRIPELIGHASAINPTIKMEDDIDWSNLDWDTPPNMERWVILPASYAESEDKENLPPSEGEPPYKGLASFQVADAPIFFGRDELIGDLINRLNKASILAVVGASGSGKSSVIRAGVVPALTDSFRRDGVPLPTEPWDPIVLTPTAQPLASIAAALYPQRNQLQQRAKLALELESDDDYGLSKELLNRSKQTKKRPILVIDQFEELFTQCKEETVRERFIRQVAGLVTHSEGNSKAIFTIRADFYDDCLRYPFLKELLSTDQAIVGAMTDDELETVIIQPAKLGEWKIQAGLVALMLRAVGNEPGRLPLLSHALHATWEKRRGRMMTLSGYDEVGGVNGAIAETAKTTYNKFTQNQKGIAKQFFSRLDRAGGRSSRYTTADQN